MENKFTTADFDKEVLEADIPVLVDFYADWCVPCKMMVPILEQLAEEYDGKLKVGKCNIDEEEAIRARYGVMSIPTMKVFVKGEEAVSVVGQMTKEELVAEISKVL